MTTLGESIFSRCGTHAGLSALIGTGTNCRCWPEELPEQATMPAVEYRQTGQDNTGFRDRSGAPSWVSAGIQFNCYGTSVDQANDVADQMVACWDGYQGDGCTVGVCFVVTRIQSQSVALDRYREIVDVDIQHTTTL